MTTSSNRTSQRGGGGGVAALVFVAIAIVAVPVVMSGLTIAVGAGLGALIILIPGLLIARRVSRIVTGEGDDGRAHHTRIGLGQLVKRTAAMRGTKLAALVALSAPVATLIPWRAILRADIAGFIAASVGIQGLAAGVWLTGAAIVAARRWKRSALAQRAEHARWDASAQFITGMSDGLWAGASWHREGEALIITGPPPAVAGALAPNARERLAQVMPGWTLDRVRSGSVAVLRPMTADETRGLEIAASSRGLVIDVAAPDDGGRVELTLGDGSPRPADVAAWLSGLGLELVGWEPSHRRAVAQELTSEQSATRARLAQQVGVMPHELTLTLGETPDGGRVIALDADALRTASRSRRRAIADEIETVLGRPGDGRQWHTTVNDAAGTMTITERVDPLSAFKIEDFERDFPIKGDPAESFKAFPIAIQESGEPVIYTTFQTLAAGQTGSGKGSVLWSILRGFLPAMRAGVAQVFGIDPKGSEFIAPSGGPNAIFTRIATDPDAWAELVFEVGALMDARKGRGRSLSASAETPAIILAIDELSALGMLDGDPKRAKAVQQELTRIASQGRSLLVFIVAAVQVPKLEAVGNLRSFMGIRIALRSATPTHTDLILGEGSEDAGARASRIEVATPANGYRSAGIGYMLLEGQPKPARIRFPEVPDEWIQDLHEEFAERHPERVTPPALTAAAVADDEDLFA